MKYPNFNEEKKLWKNGYKYIVGLDEAGRGPLAGPVVAAAVCFKHQIQSTKFQINSKFKHQRLKHVFNFGNYNLFGICSFEFQIFDVKDSKLLTSKKREQLYKIITTHKNIEWGVGVVSEKVIDKINILQATKLAMQKALENLSLSFPRKRESRTLVHKPWIPSQAGNDTTGIEFLLIDGNFGLNINIPQKSIIKGDQKVFSISAASIIAKVTRDRIMQKYHKKYPRYGFDRHKGYGTKAHFLSLKKFGPCAIHRKTFCPKKLFTG